ncbi:MAG: class I SAM-dependent methyltransferase [Candidatus Magnetominusculus sp. LBB02]|nr:class I SAM-dependent methyltransferase [Candidatus Magnetominusculus sp. LBB02]
MLRLIGIDTAKIIENIQKWSVGNAAFEQGYEPLMVRLMEIKPDLSEQYSSGKELYNKYKELKLRAMHAFQTRMMLNAVEGIAGEKITVVDIGDSSGTHMLYLKRLSEREIDTVSVNLDARAVDKIKAGGQRAILCRAEELDTAGLHADLFTSFEMVEHLHNPALFLKRLAVKSSCNRMLITVPYVRKSRVALNHIRNQSKQSIHAEDVHIFELSPEDWTLVFLHSGWKILDSATYCQYPRAVPIVRTALSWFWRKDDFEGFWGALLEKDTSYMEAYLDWDD